MTFSKHWQAQLDESIATFAKLAADAQRVDFTYGILATAILWPIHESLQAYEGEAIDTVREIVGVSVKHILKVVQDWEGDRLAAARNLAIQGEENHELRAALLTLINYFGAMQMFAGHLAQAFAHRQGSGDIYNITEQIKSALVNIGGVTSIDELKVTITMPSKPESTSRKEARDRSEELKLLAKVHEKWIQGVLNKSLRNAVLMELGKEVRPEALLKFSMEVEAGQQQPYTLPPDKNINDVFDEAYEALLILGKPGAGKTTMLLELARSRIERAKKDPAQPLPVIFNLSSWTPDKSLADWLVDELWDNYSIQNKHGRAWVEGEDQLLLLLDGLDEVSLVRQRACVEAINQFRQDYRTPIAICCRIEEYKAIEEKLDLEKAVFLQPLEFPQINAYLAQWGDEFSAFRTAFQKDNILQELAMSPFMLNIMLLAYHNKSIEDLSQFDSIEARREHVFTNYQQRMFEHRRREHRGKKKMNYSQLQIIQKLSWLARGLTQHARTEFSIKLLQPSWLQTRGQRGSYVVGSVLLSMVLLGIVGMVIDILISLFYVDIFRLVKSSNRQMIQLMYDQLRNLGAWAYLVSFLPPAIIGIIISTVNAKSEIRYVEKFRWSLRWSWTTAGKGLLFGFIYGLIFGLFIGLVLQLTGGLNEFQNQFLENVVQMASSRFDQIAPNLDEDIKQEALQRASSRLLPVFVSYVVLIFGLSGGIHGGFGGLLIGGGIFGGLEVKQVSKEFNLEWSFLQSAKNALIIGMSIMLVTFLIVVLIGYLLGDLGSGLLIGMNFAVPSGLLGGMIYGGSTVIQHFTLRTILYYRERIPWHLNHILDYATEHVFLYKVGDGYIFIHRLLLDYFATLDADDPLEELLLQEDIDAGTTDFLLRLRQFMIEQYELEEIRAFCLDLGLNYDDLGGKGTRARVSTFLLRLGRRHHLTRLLNKLRQTRSEFYYQAGLSIESSVLNSFYTLLLMLETKNQTVSQRTRYALALLENITSSRNNITLSQSLPSEALLNLSKEIWPDAIESDTEFSQLETDELRYNLPSEKNIADIFEETGRLLLILGEAGAGKTTMLAEIANTAVIDAQHNTNLPIPVIFNLSSWSEDESISEWLTHELNEMYSVPKRRARSLISENGILLLLDDLDKVAVTRQSACVKAINRFCDEHSGADLAVCCRVKAYEAIDLKFKFQSAVFIEPLTPLQIEGYLLASGEEFRTLRNELRHNGVLAELATCPYMLYLMSRTFQDTFITGIPRLASAEAQCNHLFETYIKQVIKSDKNATQYKPERIIHFLSWLAQYLSEHNQVRFRKAGSQIQPWNTETKRTMGRLCGTLAGILASVLFVALGEMQGSNDASAGLVYAFACFGIFYGALGGALGGFGIKIRLMEIAPNQSIWEATKKSGIIGLIFASVSGILLFFLLLASSGIIAGLVFGLGGGLISGLFYALVFRGLIELFYRTFNLLRPVITHFNMWRHNNIPWNRAHLLDYTSRLGLLQKAGKGYVFSHPQWFDYFLEMKAATEQRHILLREMKTLWIDGLLKTSLQDRPLIELEKEILPTALEPLQETILQTSAEQGAALSSDKKITDIFEESGRSLLMLGDQDSGKTIALLEIAQSTIAHAQQDYNQPIPVVLSLSSWEEKQPFVEWIVHELNEKYAISEAISKYWLKNDKLLLLLDDLDKVKPEYQEACIASINHFCQKHPLTNIVVCSCTDEYEASDIDLKLQNTVLLCPLTPQQVDNYLVTTYSKTFKEIKIAIQNEADFQVPPTSPLLLNIITQIYRTKFAKTVEKLDLEARKYRDILSNKVRATWIEGRLKKSLLDDHLINLEKETRPGATDSLRRTISSVSIESQKPLPKEKTIIETFYDLGQSLLILGEIGSGKTTMLLEITRVALVRLQQDFAQPIPVILNLSWWHEGQSLIEWLTHELYDKYTVPENVGSYWIKNERLLLLFDGLDEVKLERRKACVEAINHFLQEYPATSIGVCSRADEYEAISSKLKLQNAIHLQPITSQQIQDYLMVVDNRFVDLLSITAQCWRRLIS